MLNSRKNTTALPEASEVVAGSVAGDANTFADLSPLGLMMSRDRHICWCNERFAAMFGYVCSELIGKSLAILYPSHDEFERIGQRGLHVMAKSPLYKDERLMRLRNGHIQWFRVHGRGLDASAPFQLASWIFEPLSAGTEVDRLTVREREVLSAMTRGLTSKECAKELHLSPRTIEKVRAQLLNKFEVNNAAALMSKVGGLPD